MSNQPGNEISQPKDFAELSDEELATVTGGTKPKLKELIDNLEGAGFTLRRGKGQGQGNHRVWEHTLGQTISLSGINQPNQIAKPYQIKQVKQAIVQVGGSNYSK